MDGQMGSGGGMGAFDAIQEHLNRVAHSNSYSNGQSPTDASYSGLVGAGAFDDEELKKYLVSPQSANASTPQDITATTTTTTTASTMPNFPTAAAGHANAPPSQQSLESALAALGETGRQQLLAILQLATSPGNIAKDEKPAMAALSNKSMDLQRPSGQPGSSDRAMHSTVAAPANSTSRLSKTASGHFQFPSSSSSSLPNNREHAQVSQEGGVPAYFANAFNQYSKQASYPGNALIGNSSSGGSGSGSGSGSGGSNPRDGSTPGSSSSKTSPALGPVGSSYSTSKSTNSAAGDRFKHSSSGSVSGAPMSALENIAFTLPDSNYYRSPGMAPGTSSSAFYTESGLGDDSDLLFTPLLSPALTASTQPGPSVGPLPESFANMGTDFSSSYSKQNKQNSSNSNYSGSTGVSPMNFFSPLTSPALRPQAEHGIPMHHVPSTRQQQNNHAPTASSSNNSSTRRGATKNTPKIRPSPIMRPIETSSNNINNTGNNSQSARSSKRNSLVNQSPINSNPTSPMFYSAPHHASSSLSNLTKIHEHTAQDALKDSPSPHQFDLSSTNSAAALLAAAIQYQQQNHHYPNPHEANQQQQAQQQPQQQQQQQHFVASNGINPYNPSQHGQEGNTAFQAANVPSPLDLNSIFGLLGPSASAGVASNDYGPKKHDGQGDFLHASPEETGMNLDGSSNSLPEGQSIGTGFDLAEYAAFFQNEPQQQQQHISSSKDTSPNLHPHQQQDPSSSMAHFLMSDSTGPGSSSSARLTPASFMNLPQNQYNLLSGLLADQSHQQPINTSSSQPPSAYPSAPASANTSPIFPSHFETSSIYQQNESQQHPSRSANTSAGTVKQHISPAIVAQNIKEVAAAAIAAKEAKSAAKGRGAGRKRAKSSAVSSAPADISPTVTVSTAGGGRKTGKRAAAQAAEVASQNHVNQEDEVMDDTGFRIPHNPTTTTTTTTTNSNSVEQSPVIAPETRKSSHKVAEQRRRDSLKLCFEELRFILPPINPDEDEDFVGNSNSGPKRPGENNVGGQRGRAHNVDPKHPNKGISKVAMLRKSNEYVTKLHARVDNRDAAIQTLREELRACRAALGQGLPGDNVHLDALSSVNWQELEEDVDPIAPTYKLHGLCAPGSTLVYRSTHPNIPEGNEHVQDTTMNEEEQEDEQDEEEEEYKVKRTRRTSSISQAVSTRNNARTSIKA